MFNKARSILIWLIALIVFAGSFSGCTKQTGTISSKPQELVIGIGRDFYDGPDSSDFVHGSTNVWESLTYLNEKLEPKPQLAEKFLPDNTNKVWTFTIRSGIKFHDGSLLNAETVVKNVKRFKEHPKLDDYGTFLNLEKIEAVNDNEVRFIFKKPEPAFPAKVAYFGCPIFSTQSFDSEGKIVHPYGTGPFKFEDYKKGEKITVTRNDNYWGGKVKLSKVTFKIIPDPTTRLSALQTGEIQAIADVGGVLPEQANIIKNNSNLVLLSRPVTTTHYLLFNNKKAPFNDVNLRQAVSFSIDRSQLVDKVMEGYGEPAETIFTPLAKTWVVRGLWRYDKNKASEIMNNTKSGIPHKAVFVINSSLANRWPYKAISEIMQSELKTLGFEVELKMLEMGAWKEALKKGEYDLTLTPYTLMTGDPDFFFGRWIYSKGQMNIQRGIGYNNPEADRIIDAAAIVPELSKRKELYDELQRLVAKDVPLSPIYNDVCLYATRKEIQNLKLDPFFKPSLEKAWIK
ncbi:ABC transporter substrate-binding protein [Aceticella autotrophica]|uniref:ABC transporter substrate-binding protein n=1 Tax=Aceticella autotrophica TaxID=2755338 RepID=A0A975G9G6_9THEO|nr:ABC transporter substrate-binding protein [Aceticella autotrophica]QSZ26784.1 ABC transporter substrate-binding protein [Aceticella autotrophica]